VLFRSGVGWTPDAGYVLHGLPDDPRLTWMTHQGQRLELEWPVGYSARFTPQLELLNDQGEVVGHEGSHLDGGCQPVPGIWWVDVGL